MGGSVERYEKSFEVRALDLDVNRHLTSPAYLSYAIHARMSALADLGLLEVLEAERMAPVLEDAVHSLKGVRHVKDVRNLGLVAFRRGRVGVRVEQEGRKRRLRHAGCSRTTC